MGVVRLTKLPMSAGPVPDTSTRRLVRVTAPYLCAGVVVESRTSRILDAAPIIRWAVGHTIEDLRRHARRKRWTMEELS